VRITFLGTGTSSGVPAIGCDCATCRSNDPRDQRWRPSIYIELVDGVAVLIDAATDLRAQALRFGISRVDAVLFTHSHADHVLGLDEVRRYNYLQGKPIPCYGDSRTLSDVRRMFAYVFDHLSSWVVACLNSNCLLLVVRFALVARRSCPCLCYMENDRSWVSVLAPSHI